MLRCRQNYSQKKKNTDFHYFHGYTRRNKNKLAKYQLSKLGLKQENKNRISRRNK